MSTADATVCVSVVTTVGLVLTTLINQVGADRARKQELALKRLQLEEEENEREERAAAGR